MDNFDSKDFYGHSLSGDPKLRTTTRNYEFKYNSSDHLERVISRVKMDRDKKKLNPSSSRMMFPSMSKLRTPLPKLPTSPMYQSSSIETHIGKSTSRMTVVKVMSDAEIDAMISQAMLASNTSLPISTEVSSISLREIPSNVSSMGTESVGSFFKNYQPVSPKYRRIEIKIPRHSVQVLLDKQPQWVEIKPTQKAVASVMDLPSTSDTDITTDISVLHIVGKDSTNDNNLAEKTSNEVNLSDELSLESKMSDDFVLRNEEYNSETKEIDSPPESPMSIGIESHLNEYERAEMQRVLGKVLPHVPVMEFDHLDSQDDRSSASSEYIDEQDEFEDEDGLQDEDGNQDDDTCYEKEEPEKNNKGVVKSSAFNNCAKPIDSNRSSVTETAKSYRTSRSASFVSPNKKHTLDSKMKKQIEILKHEKIRIFSKMTSIQEKIIELLDRLRMSLLELSLPDGHVEIKIRERNAFEFSVRFSRNYLFPLGKMIEELRVSPKEDYRSAITNEPCIRVCGIYGLLNQALQCYHKQLRHFFTDSVPKKLDILLNMILDTTNMCLQKKIFDNRDTLIQCLLLRCNVFIEFVMKFAQQKRSYDDFDTPQRSGRRESVKFPKTSSKWDLTMNLNNLNMYEPRLVPKKPKRTPHKRTIQSLIAKATAKSKETNKQNLGDSMESTQSRDMPDSSVKQVDSVALPAPDPIDTQVRFTSTKESLQLINTAIEEYPDSELTKTVIEALQDITKDEVRQMLRPIFLNLDSILRNTDNPQSVKSVLSALSSQLLARCKQQKADAAAAESNTQNIGTNQKEVTKKGADSGNKPERHKDSRQKQRAASKTKPTSNSNNVKEDSTEQTERHNSRRGRTIRDKQSVSNSDVAGPAAAVGACAVAMAGAGARAGAASAACAAAAAVDENDLMIRKNRSRAFVGSRTVVTAAAKKPTPQTPPVMIQIGISPPPPIQMELPSPPPAPPAPPQSPSTPYHKMTSQSSEFSDSKPMMEVPRKDKFAARERQQWIGDGGGYPSPRGGYRRDFASERELNNKAAAAAAGAAAAAAISHTELDGEVDNHHREGAWRRNQLSSATNVGATATDQIEQFNYTSNAMFTFVRHCEDTPPLAATDLELTEHNREDVPEEECFTDSCTRLMFSAKPSRNASFKSACSSNQNLLSSQEDYTNNEDIRVLNEERRNFIEKCTEDPLYTNPQFPQPWKVLSKISASIAQEIVGNFENDISFGEDSYVRDFIDMETRS